MQEQDKITQENKDKIRETAGENAGAPNVQTEAATAETNQNLAEKADLHDAPQPAPEIPAAGSAAETGTGEIPAVELADAPAAQEFGGYELPASEPEGNEEGTPEERLLFHGYEVKSWEFNPRIYKILTGSTVFCLLTLFAVAQSNFLFAKACDSPFVGKVCQVLDTVYVGSTLLGTDSEWVDQPYERTELEDAEITYIDVSNVSPPLNYPEGYFPAANPEMAHIYNPTTDDLLGGTTQFPITTPPPMTPPPTTNVPYVPPPSSNPITKTPRFPKTNPNLNNQELPDDGISIGGNPIGENKSEENKKPEKSDKTETANNADKTKQVDPTQPVAEFRPNREPLKSFAKEILKLREKQNGKLDLSRNFTVEMNGTLTAEGKFDRKKSAYVRAEGDEEMVNIAKDAIEAVGDSQLLYYLKGLGVEKINFVIQQNEEGIFVVLKSSQPSEERAKSLSSGFGGLLMIGKNTVKPEEKEVITLLNAAKYSSEGKNFVLNFKLDKETAQAMIKEQLDKEAQKIEEEKQKAQQPSSTTDIPAANKNTGK